MKISGDMENVGAKYKVTKVLIKKMQFLNGK